MSYKLPEKELDIGKGKGERREMKTFSGIVDTHLALFGHRLLSREPFRLANFSKCQKLTTEMEKKWEKTRADAGKMPRPQLELPAKVACIYYLIKTIRCECVRG